MLKPNKSSDSNKFLKRGKSIHSINITNKKSISNIEKKTNIKVCEVDNVKTLCENRIVLDRINSLNIDTLPNIGFNTKIMTYKNINSVEILSKIDEKYKIINYNACFSSINHVGIKEMNKYNLNRVVTNGKNELTCKGFKLKFNKHKILPSHLRNFTIKCENDNYISVVTSANPSISSRNESYVIFNSIDIYNYINKATHEFNENDEEIKNTDELSVVDGFNSISINNINLVDTLHFISKNEDIKEISLIQHAVSKRILIKVNDIFKNANKIRFFLCGLAVFQKSSFEHVKAISLKFNGIIKINATHSKITLVKTNNNYYTFLSTANFGSNTKIEHTMCFKSIDDYEFFINFANEFFK